MKFTAEVSIKGKPHPKRFEFNARDLSEAAKLINDYCASLGITVDAIDVRQHLSRVSGDYRRGYHDGHAKREKNFQGAPDPFNGRPFAASDYDNGYSAGANDRKWSDHYAAEFHSSREG